MAFAWTATNALATSNVCQHGVTRGSYSDLHFVGS